MSENTEIGSWKRQVDDNVTKKQIVFDTLFGIVIPILCLVFDPVVFRGGWALLSELSIFAYSAIGFGICSFGLWLLFRDQLPFEVLGMITGILSIGSILSFIFGFVLLPVSIFGVAMYGLGLLGFTPFFTAYVYHRNSKRALNHIKRNEPSQNIAVLMLIGMILVLVIPIGFHWYVNNFR